MSDMLEGYWEVNGLFYNFRLTMGQLDVMKEKEKTDSVWCASAV